MSTILLRDDARRLFNRVHVVPKLEPGEKSDTKHLQKEFDHVERLLNETKSLLNDKEPVSWRKHSSYCNKASRIAHKLGQVLGRNIPLVTQAFLKFFEILLVYKELLVKDAQLRSFHLCEAPGAFITALEQYLLQVFGTSSKWEWKASTLNPYFEGNSTDQTFVDDRLIFETLDRWVFGSSGTGNIFSLEIEKDFMQQFDLVTADGSIDCQSYPANQEHQVLPLFCTEIRCAFRLLRDGGSLVLKMFTFFSSRTRQILQMLRKSFEQLHIRKPSCSRSSNSEVYIICVGFRVEESRAFLPELDRFVNNKGEIQGELSEALSSQFEEVLLETTRSFCEAQMASIRENVENHQDMTRRQREKLEIVKTMVADMYVSKLHVTKLAPEVERQRRLSCVTLTKPSLSKGRAWNVVPYENRGNSKWWMDYAPHLLSRLRELHPRVFTELPQRKIIYERDQPLDVNSIQISTGECCSVVTVSKFIEQSLLDLYYMIFPPSPRAESTHRAFEKVKNTEKNEITITLHADFSSNQKRLLFLREVEQKLETIADEPSAVLLKVEFTETISRFSAGLMYLFSQVFDEVEFEHQRIDHICFTFSLDDGRGPEELGKVLQVIQVVRKALEECSNHITVTEIFPLRTICLSSFFKFLRDCNERYYATNKSAVELLRLAEKSLADDSSCINGSVLMEPNTD